MFHPFAWFPPAQQSEIRCHPARLVQKGHGVGHRMPRAPWQGEHGLVKESGFCCSRSARGCAHGAGDSRDSHFPHSPRV